ncbi:hypothetical protein C8R46DRAFT_1028422 [Mycena filopes]|nr:hypothetical protein C8R46DRAFT_1028422 [Mycena filopes]
MKHKNLILRRHLAYVKSQLETESTSSRHRPRLKEERQHRLTEEKIAIQKSLDAIVYPVLTFPVEITGEIFMRCLPELPAHPSGTIAPMLTPRLWAALEVARWAGPNLALLVHLWFGRAGGAPKSLSLQLPFSRCPNSFFGAGVDCCPSSSLFTDHWTHLSSFRGSDFTPAECLALLSRAPRLAHCSFDDLEDSPLPSTPASRLVLANLEHLSLKPCIRSSLLLLDSITCPALRSFQLHSGMRSSTDTIVIPFLKRAPYIEAFTTTFYADPEILIAMLNAMPTLTFLRVIAQETTTFHLLRLLGESPTFLPHNTNIFLSPYTGIGWTDSQVKTLVDAVTSRWEAKLTAQLLDFEFALRRPALHDRIVACVSGLKSKGMRIHETCPGGCPAMIWKRCRWAGSRGLKVLNYWKSVDRFYCVKSNLISLHAVVNTELAAIRAWSPFKVSVIQGSRDWLPSAVKLLLPTYLQLNSRLAKGQTQNLAPSGDAAPNVPLRSPSNYLGLSGEHHLPGAAATSSTQEWARFPSGASRRAHRIGEKEIHPLALTSRTQVAISVAP